MASTLCEVAQIDFRVNQVRYFDVVNASGPIGLNHLESELVAVSRCAMHPLMY